MITSNLYNVKKCNEVQNFIRTRPFVLKTVNVSLPIYLQDYVSDIRIMVIFLELHYLDFDKTTLNDQFDFNNQNLYTKYSFSNEGSKL